MPQFETLLRYWLSSDISIHKKRPLTTVKGPLRYLFLGFNNSCKAAATVAYIVESRTEDGVIGAIKEANKLVLRWIQMTSKHFLLFSLSKTRVEVLLAGDLSDWFNYCIHLFRI